MEKNSKIYIAGHKGIAGSAIYNKLKYLGYNNLIVKSHQELDLCDKVLVKDFFEAENPEYIFFAAAKICKMSNYQQRADILYQNIQMQTNILELAYRYKVKKMLYIASAYMYPQNIDAEITENHLLTGELEYKCETYALTKILGCKMCEAYNLQYDTNFIAIAPVNLYGYHSDFNLNSAGVVNALMRKIHLAKLLQTNQKQSLLSDLKVQNYDEAVAILNQFGITDNTVEIWGTGKSRREFLFSEDLADVSIFLLNEVNFSDLVNKNDDNVLNTHLNIGTGDNYSIAELANIIKKVIGYKGDFYYNTAKPDNKINRITNCSKINSFGWKPIVEIEEGIRKLYNWYLQDHK